MNDTVILMKVPGEGPEFWVTTIIHRKPVPWLFGVQDKTRRASPNREEAVNKAVAELWISRRGGYFLD